MAGAIIGAMCQLDFCDWVGTIVPSSSNWDSHVSEEGAAIELYHIQQ